MKKVLLLFIIILSFFVGTIVSADLSPKVIVNGNYLDSNAIMQNDRVYVPLRAVAESMGAEVSWDDSSNTASINYANENDLTQMIAEVSKSVVAIVGNYQDGSINEHVEATAHGTGVIIKSGGEILTNCHVVKNLESIIVVMSDGLGYEARLKYIDEEMDLAVVKIDRIGLPVIKFADPEDIIAGKTVVAIGTPISFSLRNSASKGIISGVNCQIGSSYRLIQTDAAINPGNSGGPLVNIKGELVGINSSKFVSVGIEGMGFSIPINNIKYALNQFETYGKIKRPYIGVTFEESWASQMGLPTQDGLTVIKIESGSAGESADLRIDDVIVSIGDRVVHSIVDYNEVMMNYLPGDTAVFTFYRNGERLQTEVILNEK